jgi:hypothetical protein
VIQSFPISQNLKINGQHLSWDTHISISLFLFFNFFCVLMETSLSLAVQKNDCNMNIEKRI